MNPDQLKAIIREVFDFAEEQFKKRVVIVIALNAAETVLLDSPLWDMLVGRLLGKGLVNGQGTTAAPATP